MGTTQPAQDDIVTRLRMCELEYGTGEVCMEAADEIEELRATVRELRSEVQRLTYA